MKQESVQDTITQRELINSVVKEVVRINHHTSILRSVMRKASQTKIMSVEVRNLNRLRTAN